MWRVDERAIETLTRGLAREPAPGNIRVNTIAPGQTETEGNIAAGTFDTGTGAALAKKTPLGRLGRVTDIARLAGFLTSDESAWITGEVIRAAWRPRYGNLSAMCWRRAAASPIKMDDAALQGDCRYHSDWSFIEALIPLNWQITNRIT